MKPLKYLLTAIFACSLLVACNSQQSATPSEVTKEFLTAYQDHDNEKLKETSLWTTFDASSLELTQQDFVKGVKEELQRDVYQKMMAFEHSEDKEEVQKDQAIVYVTLTLYDFTPVVTKGLEEATKKAEELSQQATISDDQIQSEILTILFEHMSKAEQNKKVEVQVNLTKKDGVWLVSEDNDDLRKALLQNSKAVEQVA